MSPSSNKDNFLSGVYIIEHVRTPRIHCRFPCNVWTASDQHLN